MAQDLRDLCSLSEGAKTKILDLAKLKRKREKEVEGTEEM